MLPHGQEGLAGVKLPLGLVPGITAGFSFLALALLKFCFVFSTQMEEEISTGWNVGWKPVRRNGAGRPAKSCLSLKKYI